jgi:hypothetical protein
MLSLDSFSVRFTAIVLAIFLLGFAAHYAVARIGVTGGHTLDQRKADDKSHTR